MKPTPSKDMESWMQEILSKADIRTLILQHIDSQIAKAKESKNPKDLPTSVTIAKALGTTRDRVYQALRRMEASGQISSTKISRLTYWYKL